MAHGDGHGDGTRERQWKKRKKEREKDPDEQGQGNERKRALLQDPLEVFGTDIMIMILRYVDARSVALSRLVCRSWNAVASSDRLWSSKTRIMRDDLCDHAWQFHFKKAAPVYWRDLDPYWQGSSHLMRRYFHPDGSQTADPNDRVWGGHECCFSTVTSFVGDGKIREHYVRINRWPRMFVSRNEDWSWEMSNQLASYSSIPDADKDGGTGPLF